MSNYRTDHEQGAVTTWNWFRYDEKPDVATVPTPIVCKGTACENTMGAVCLDVTTYVTYCACLVGAIVFAWPGAPAGLRGMIVALFVLLTWIVWRRCHNWRVRKAKLAAGVARLLASRPADATTTQPHAAVAAAAVQLPVLKFYATHAGQARRRAADSSAGGVPCAICLADLEPSAAVHELPCRHCFHRACLAEWLRVGQATCPSCRGALAATPDVEAGPPAPPREASVDGKHTPTPPAAGTKIP